MSGIRPKGYRPAEVGFTPPARGTDNASLFIGAFVITLFALLLMCLDARETYELVNALRWMDWTR